MAKLSHFVLSFTLASLFLSSCEVMATHTPTNICFVSDLTFLLNITSSYVNSSPEAVSPLCIYMSTIFKNFSDIKLAVDTTYLLFSTYIVFTMQIGFAMVSVGLIRAKNVQNIMLCSLLDAASSSISFYIFGFVFTLGTPSNGFIEHQWKYFALNTFLDDSGYDFTFFISHCTYDVTPSGITSCSVAERTRFMAYLLYPMFFTSFAYLVISHWFWANDRWASPTRANNNLLLGLGAFDFVGAGVVHMVGGIDGFLGSLNLGPRIGRFNHHGNHSSEINGYGVPFVVIDKLILWLEWYGFTANYFLTILKTYSISASYYAQWSAIGRTTVTTTLSLKNTSSYIYSSPQSASSGIGIP